MEFETLLELYLTYSPSGAEHELAEIVKRELSEMAIDFKEDKDGNIYRLIPDTPLLCAHMDQVSKKPLESVEIVDDIIFGDGNLGADDKNGVWIILTLLKRIKGLSFIFSTQEEMGGNIDDLLDDNEEIMESIKYGLVFDRRNGTDIIGTHNDYCCEEFEKDLAELGVEFGYSPAMGIFSDCNNLSDYISCVNLSCGYYNSHTAMEYTKISELVNAVLFGEKILKTIDKQYKAPEKQFRYSPYYGYTWVGEEGEEFDDEEYWFCERCVEYWDVEDTNEDEWGDKLCIICSNILMPIDPGAFENHYHSKFDSMHNNKDGYECIDYNWDDKATQKALIDRWNPSDYAACTYNIYKDM